jgi:hypothetical protein
MSLLASAISDLLGRMRKPGHHPLFPDPGEDLRFYAPITVPRGGFVGPDSLERAGVMMHLVRSAGHIADFWPNDHPLAVSCAYDWDDDDSSTLQSPSVEIRVVNVKYREARLEKEERRAACIAACVSLIRALDVASALGKDIHRLIARDLWTTRRLVGWDAARKPAVKRSKIE